MKTERINERKNCPACGKAEGQMKNGRNRSGTQTYCRFCKKVYTPEPKQRGYDEEAKKLALKMYYSGVSGRGEARYWA